jgi:hypothetical protein
MPFRLKLANKRLSPQAAKMLEYFYRYIDKTIFVIVIVACYLMRSISEDAVWITLFYLYIKAISENDIFGIVFLTGS